MAPDDRVTQSSDQEIRTEAVSRRDLLLGGVAALGGGVVAGSSTPASAGVAPQAPAVLTGTMTGRKYRGMVYERGRGAEVTTLTMLPLDPDRVVVRTQASFLSYDKCQQVLYPGDKVPVGGYRGKPLVLGDGGVGIVEAVGSRVRRVAVGDRVVVHDTPYCGLCFNCLRGRADRCELGQLEWGEVASADDGRRVTQHNNGGGYAELLIAHEWYCQPVFASASSAELSLFMSEGAVGLGCALGVAPVEVASDVCVFGCGPVGLSAIQGARIKGATRIIAVEPIAARREVAMRVGATDVINPADYFKKDDLDGATGAGTEETDELVKKIRDMCKGPVGRPFAGGRFPNLNRNTVGPDYVIEAVGGDAWLPGTGPSPDPTGILSLKQAWKLNSAAGHLATCSVLQQGNISFTGAAFSNGAKAQHPGNMNGINTMRDMQRFARLVDSGQFNAKAIVAETCSLDRMKETYLKVAQRSIVGAAVTFA